MGSDAASERPEFEAIVIGTGFGGAVTACRLAQAGVRLCVLERGRRYQPDDFPAPPRDGEVLPDAHRWLWEQGQGLWDLRNLDGIGVVQAAGWGGGSLVYANVHLRPPDDVFDGHWPEDIQKGRLAAEYDLVGTMLDIRPVALPGGAPPPNMVGKVSAMRAAFAAAGDAACVFHPPLAIKLDDPTAPPRDNGHRRLQRGCQACGGCNFGCRYGAKNTLDFNYLAEVEDRRNAHVLTLAEVEMISRRDGPDGGGYDVYFRDHLIGERRTVSAATVFVCAGSVNTTELLLRGQEQGRKFREHGPRPAPGFDPTLGPGLPELGGGLGRDYFANADAVGLVYDTVRKVDPEAGPVITTSLVHNDAGHGGHGPWFLIQDGGYPEVLRRLGASLESPAFFNRNRHDDRPDAAPRLAAVARPAPPRPERWGSVLDGLGAALVAGDLPVERVVPAQVRRIFTAMRQGLSRQVSDEVEAIAAPVADHYVSRVTDDIINLSRWVFGLGFLPPFRRWARRFLENYASRRLGITPAEIRMRAIEAGWRRWGLDRPGAALATLAAWLGGEPNRLMTGREPDRDPWAHRAVLLAMGRDDSAGRIVLEGDHLSVRYPLDAKAPTYSAEEQVMRAVSAGLGGRLRLSPLWAFGRRPVTVHSQGGCALRAPRVEHPVTDEYGEVLASPGLFVNDGSLLPRSVGVNPSSTIAALAERNVRRAWEGRFRKPGQDELPWAAELKAAAIWSARQNPVTLGPPRGRPPLRREPAPVGLEFMEVMTGFWTPLDAPAAAAARPEALPPVASYLAAELEGRRAGRVLSFDLKCVVPDIEAFFADPTRPIVLGGQVRLIDPGGQSREGGARGRLHLLTEEGRGRREMTYVLDVEFPDQTLHLVGRKLIKDDPGLDAWIDAATLYTDASSATGRHLRGILRLTLTEFLTVQLSTMTVTGTSDPARIVWVLGRFAWFFFTSFQRVYLPELDRVADLLAPDRRSSRPRGRRGERAR